MFVPPLLTIFPLLIVNSGSNLAYSSCYLCVLLSSLNVLWSTAILGGHEREWTNESLWIAQPVLHYQQHHRGTARWRCQHWDVQSEMIKQLNDVVTKYSVQQMVLHTAFESIQTVLPENPTLTDCQESHSELSDSPLIRIRGIDRGWSIPTRVGCDQLQGLEVGYEAVSCRGQLMASNTNCEEGTGSTYVLAHQLPPPCQSESQTSCREKHTEQRKQRQGD